MKNIALEHKIKPLQLHEERSAENKLKELVKITTSLFGDEVTISESCDPEFPNDTYIVFSVSPLLSIPEIIEAELQWAKGVKQACPGFDSVRLLIIPK